MVVLVLAGTAGHYVCGIPGSNQEAAAVMSPPIDYIYTYKSILRLGLSSACEQNILALAVAFGDAGLTASNNTLATELGASRGTIIRAIKRLEQRCFITVEQGKNGRIVYASDVLSGIKARPLEEQETPISSGDAPPPQDSSGSALQQSGIKALPKYKVTKEEAESFADYWNGKENLPTIRKITPQRKAQLKTRMQEPDFAENWEGIIDRVAASAFCTGKNDRGWKADIDWILKNSGNYTKVLEGKYDNKQESVGSEYASQPVETVFEKKLKAEKKCKLQEATNV